MENRKLLRMRKPVSGRDRNVLDDILLDLLLSEIWLEHRILLGDEP